MIDFILAGLSAGLLAFLALFIISFVTLGLITGVIHWITVLYRNLFFVKTQASEKQAA